jgi:hypothetical protein
LLNRLLGPSDDPAGILNTLVRSHWRIENSLHRKRDVVFGEDNSPIRNRAGPAVMAALNNLVTTLLHRGGITRSFPETMRRFAAHPEELFAFLGLAKGAYPDYLVA